MTKSMSILVAALLLGHAVSAGGFFGLAWDLCPPVRTFTLDFDPTIPGMPVLSNDRRMELHIDLDGLVARDPVCWSAGQTFGPIEDYKGDFKVRLEQFNFNVGYQF